MNQFNSPYGRYGQTTAGAGLHLTKYLRKPIFLAIPLLSFILLAITTLNNIISASSKTTITNYYNFNININGKYQYYDLTVLFTIFAAILALIPIIGYIVTFFQARANKAPVAGVTLLQASVIISIILCSLATFLYVIFMVIFFAVASSAGGISSILNSSSSIYGSTAASLSILMIILFFVFLIVLFFVMMYQIAAVLLASSAKKILHDNGKKLSGAGLIGGLNVTLAVLYGIATLILIFGLIVFAASDSTAYSGAFRNYTKPQMLINFATVLVITLIDFILSILKAKAAFGAKRHMSYFNASPQAPTGQYSNGYASNSYNSGYNPYQGNYQGTDSQYNSTYTDTSNYGNPYSNDSQNGGGY